MAFSWMREAGTVNICTRCTDPSASLALGADDSTVKCYMADTGLLSTMAFSAAGDLVPDAYRQVLLGDDGVNQGMLVENAVAQQLATAGHELYFYSKNSAEKDERMEIDFLVVRPFSDAAMKPRVSPIEVKSGKRYSTLSLDKFSKKFGKQAGTEYVLHPRQLATEKSRVYLPLYMAHLL